MYEMCKTVAHDGGDGVMNIEGEEDYWGLIGAALTATNLFWAAMPPW